MGGRKEGEEKREIADFICLRVTGEQASRQAVKGNKAAFASFPPTAPLAKYNGFLSYFALKSNRNSTDSSRTKNTQENAIKLANNVLYFKMEPRPISPPPSSFTLYSPGGGGRLKLQQRRMQTREERWGRGPLWPVFMYLFCLYIGLFRRGKGELQAGRKKGESGSYNEQEFGILNDKQTKPLRT